MPQADNRPDQNRGKYNAMPVAAIPGERPQQIAHPTATLVAHTRIASSPSYMIIAEGNETAYCECEREASYRGAASARTFTGRLTKNLLPSRILIVLQLGTREAQTISKDGCSVAGE